MWNLAVMVLSVSLFGGGNAQAADGSCNEIESKSALLRLRKYLFCDYDQMVRPTANYRNATSVRFGLVLTAFDVDEDTNLISLHAIPFLNWKDEHLTWEPSGYEDVKGIQVKSYELWFPDIALYNAGNADHNEKMPHANCWLGHDGNVYCAPPVVYSAHCNADHTWWPYDYMECRVNFGSWSYSTSEVEFRFLQPSEVVDGLLTMEKQQLNPDWELYKFFVQDNVAVSKHKETYKTQLISYHMLLRRQGHPFASSFTTQVVVMMLMTLLTVWLDPKSPDRMILANLNVIVHLLCLHDLFWRIPYSGINPQRLLIIYEGSLALASGCLILTTVLRQLQTSKKNPPSWISSMTTTILTSRIGKILSISILDPKMTARIELSAEDNVDLVASGKKETSQWQGVVIIIGWLAFFVVFGIYVVIISLNLPTSSSLKLDLANS